jgi:putative transposase
MATSRKPDQPERLPTIWSVPDDLWGVIERILAEHDPPAKTGRGRIDSRAALNAIIFRARTGCQWNQLPDYFPDDSSVHRTMQRWVKKKIFLEIWGRLVDCADDLGEVEWEWQSADGAMGKARHGGDGVGPNPTDRGKKRDQATPAGGGRRRPARGRGRRSQSTRQQAA